MEFDSTTPIYIQIAEELRHEILIGALDEGDQVMSTTKYATTYRINPATAAKAFTALVDEGLLVKKRGIGMFVAAGARERLRTTGRARFIQDSLLPVVEEALALGLTPNDLIDAIHTHAQSAETHTKEH
ncbi:GntR family transcriptional regulator [Schaalia cardiffensis F0333]|uniref:GntR family transcriptional regulator n=1 Tax=Schaalia cardiffensis F0333 TaxID=888050 RepID=N6W608_9ACTO|nr:GntR family transcriptional regulator [Schaalia cardiffensis]ENO17945.1 GntR family transcriptional regulator [Schaalia cardiffensis F0333]